MSIGGYRCSFIFYVVSLLGFISCSTNNSVSMNHPETTKSLKPKVLASMPLALSTPKQPTSPDKTFAAQTDSVKNIQSIKPTIGALSKEWKLHPYEIKKQTAALEAFLRRGKYPSNYCLRGKAKKPEARKLCEQVSLIVESYSRRTPTKQKSRVQLGFSKTGERFRLNSGNLAWAQRKHFDDIIETITPMQTAQISNWVPQIIKHSACPRNLSAAAIRKLENFLPDDEAKLAIEKLYAHASICLKPSDSAYALTHMRQSLLRVLWGDSNRARVSAELAVIGATGEELPRALFWAGLLQDDLTKKQTYWTKLINDHPLSFHAINAHRHMNLDPLTSVSSRPIVSPSRDSESKAVALSLRWFEALMLNGKETAASRLSFWMSQHHQDNLSLGNIIYVTHMKSDKNAHQASFGYVWNQIESNPDNMNKQTLQLMFPLPYWEVFKRNSGRTDPFLIVSVAKQESAFNPRAKSPANARGLLQLLPSTAHAMAGGKHVNLYSPEMNAKLGSKFLGKMIDKFQSVEMALAAYNAGPMRIPQWKKRYPAKSALLFMDLIPYKETRNYVSNILRNNYWYSRLYEDSPVRQTASTKAQSAIVKSLIKATKNAVPPQVESQVEIANANKTLEPSAR